MRTRWMALLAGAVAVAIGGLLVAGCTASSNSAANEADAPAVGAATAEAAATSAAAPDAPQEDGSAVAGGSAQPGSTGSAGTPIVDDRQIIRTATVALRVTVQPGKDDAATREARTDAASAAAARVRALAPGTGGYVSASDGGGATISVTLRIPAASYDTVMNGLAGIGEVTGRTEKTDDVTDEMVDVTSRIATMKASVDRIRALLATADKIGDVIAIESELTSREADLESLENRQTALGNQVALSTIAVTITAVTSTDIAVVQVQEHHGFLAGLAGGWRALLSFGTWLGSVVGALLPFLPVIAVAVLVTIWVNRRRRRGGVVAAAPAPAGPGNPPSDVVSQ